MSNEEKSKLIAQWFEQFGNDIYHFLIYRANINIAEDLLQDVFIKALRGLKHYKGNAHPKTWLLSIARNTTIDYIRKKQAMQQKEVDSLISQETLYTNDTPESIFYVNEDRKVIYHAIQGLKDNYQDVIILRSIQELSVSETAEVLKWSEQKVTSTHYRARLALIKNLRRFEKYEK